MKVNKTIQIIKFFLLEHNDPNVTNSGDSYMNINLDNQNIVLETQKCDPVLETIIRMLFHEDSILLDIMFCCPT